MAMILTIVGALGLVAQSEVGVKGMVVDASGGRVELVRRNDAGEFAFPAVPKDE